MPIKLKMAVTKTALMTIKERFGRDLINGISPASIKLMADSSAL